MLPERKLKFLRRALRQDGYVKGDEVHFFCPRHPARADRKVGQLSANLQTDMFHCWSCDWKGRNFVPILRLRPGPELDEYFNYFNQQLVNQEPAAIKKQFKVPELPESFRSLTTLASGRAAVRMQMEVKKYLIQRGVADEDIIRWKLGFCETGDYMWRVIFPSFDEYGELNFFVGRSIYNTKFMKYKTEDDYCKDIVFNDYLIDWRKPIILTEGPFDALKAGENAVPIQGIGCRPKTKLFHKIVKTGVDVYFAMDSDAAKKQLSLIEVFMDYGVRSFVVPMGGRKDVGEMSHTEFLEQKYKAQEINSNLDLIRMRVMT